MKEEVRDWFEGAREDYDNAVYNLQGDRTKPAGFLFHQACEKALKALQIAETGDYDRKHNLVELAQDRIPDRFMTVLADLNPVYTGVRYPDADVDIENLGNVKQKVESLLKWIGRQLKE